MLYGDFLNHTGRFISKWDHYFPIYEKHFQRFVNKSIVFWEIGVFKGGSLQLWKKYFGPYAVIVGIDIDPSCKDYEEDGIHIRIGDQSDKAFLQSVLDEFGSPDIILDDGSHIMSHVRTTFSYLYPRMDRDGVYFVEDMHTCYMERYGGGLKNKDSFMEMCKDLIDLLNAHFWCTDTTFAEATFSMSFYNSIIVFEKMVWRTNIQQKEIGEKDKS